MEWMELWGLDDSLHLFGFPEVIIIIISNIIMNIVIIIVVVFFIRIMTKRLRLLILEAY